MSKYKYLDQEGVSYLWNKIKGMQKDSLIFSKTVEEWNSDKDLISVKNVLYIYTDYKKDTQLIDGEITEILIPGIKVGDGVTYLIDLPFLNNSKFENMLLDHINNKAIHVSLKDREFWNNKLNFQLLDSDIENLVLNRE